MRLDLKDIIHVPGASKDFQFQLDLSQLEFYGSHPISRPVEAAGTVTNHAGALELRGTARSLLDLACDRCGKEFSREKAVPLDCLLLDDGEECVCVQSISYSLLCRWFKVAVLPLDAALCAEITKGRDDIKRCTVCGAAFTPNSNRAKYCPDCAVQVRRKKEAERQRKRYLLSTHLGR